MVICLHPQNGRDADDFADVHWESKGLVRWCFFGVILRVLKTFKKKQKKACG